MIEIQCTSCHTRYRLDERVLPEDTPTFKCSRCGHVFTAEPRGARRPAPSKESIAPGEKESDPAPRPMPRRVSTLRPAANTTPRPLATAVDPAAPAKPSKPPPAATPRSSEPPASIPSHGTLAPETHPSAPDVSRPEAPADDLARPLHRPEIEESTAGANLSFDFDDVPTFDDHAEPDAGAGHSHDNWQVGDEQPEFTRESIQSPPSREARIANPPAVEDLPLGDDDASFFAGRETAANRPPYAPEAGRIHSTGYILAIFVLVILAFGAGSVLICNAPMASAEFLNSLPGLGNRFAPPIVPARLVAIKNVEIAYRTIKGGKALVVTGRAMNVGNAPLHSVQLAATLQDGTRRPLAGATVFCGNNLAPAMIREMTPRELQFFQQLDPPKRFVLKPLAATPFVIVFVNPPAPVREVSLTVAKAVAASPDELAAGASGN